jgi:hypothetical protein
MDLTYYDAHGAPIAYTEDGDAIFLFSGEPVGYHDGDSVYSYGGKHLGWFEDGLIRDNEGHVAFFTEGAVGGPIKPIKQIKPIKGIKQIKPIRGIKQIKPIRAINSLSWSPVSGAWFFRQ